MDRRRRNALFFFAIMLLLVPIACNAPGPLSARPVGTTPTPLVDGPTPTAQPTITPRPSAGSSPDSCRPAAKLVASSLPYGARVNPGQSVTQTWELQNTGTCPWESASLQYAGGAGLGPATNSPTVPTTDPGGTAAISSSVQAPGRAGVHRGDWQLMDGGGRAFGPQTLSIVIEVPNSSRASGGRSTGSGQASGAGSGLGAGASGSSGFPGWGTNLPPWLSNLLNNSVVPGLSSAGLIPSPEEMAIGALDPELADALDLDSMPDLSEAEGLPDSVYIDSIPPGLLSDSSGNGDEGEIGTPPEPPDQEFEVVMTGVHKVSEYNVFGSRHLSEAYYNKVFHFDQDNPSARFSIEACESGNNKKGVKGTVYMLLEVKRNAEGNHYLQGFAGQLVTPSNCATGERLHPLGPADLETHRTYWQLLPGETAHVAPPWLSTGGLKGSSRMIFDFTFNSVSTD